MMPHAGEGLPTEAVTWSPPPEGGSRAAAAGALGCLVALHCMQPGLAARAPGGQEPLAGGLATSGAVVSRELPSGEATAAERRMLAAISESLLRRAGVAGHADAVARSFTVSPPSKAAHLAFVDDWCDDDEHRIAVSLGFDAGRLAGRVEDRRARDARRLVWFWFDGRRSLTWQPEDAEARVYGNMFLPPLEWYPTECFACNGAAPWAAEFDAAIAAGEARVLHEIDGPVAVYRARGGSLRALSLSEDLLRIRRYEVSLAGNVTRDVRFTDHVEIEGIGWVPSRVESRARHIDGGSVSWLVSTWDVAYRSEPRWTGAHVLALAQQAEILRNPTQMFVSANGADVLLDAEVEDIERNLERWRVRAGGRPVVEARRLGDREPSVDVTSDAVIPGEAPWPGIREFGPREGERWLAKLDLQDGYCGLVSAALWSRLCGRPLSFAAMYHDVPEPFLRVDRLQRLLEQRGAASIAVRLSTEQMRELRWPFLYVEAGADGPGHAGVGVPSGVPAARQPVVLWTGPEGITGLGTFESQGFQEALCLVTPDDFATLRSARSRAWARWVGLALVAALAFGVVLVAARRRLGGRRESAEVLA